MILNIVEVFQFIVQVFFFSYEVKIFASLASGRSLFRLVLESVYHGSTAFLFADVKDGSGPSRLFPAPYLQSAVLYRALVPLCGEWCRVLGKLAVTGWGSLFLCLFSGHI